MDEERSASQVSWGARINSGWSYEIKDFPDWANPRQREQWAKKGLILWEYDSRVILRLSATQALALLDKRDTLRPLTSDKYLFPNTQGNPLTDNALNKSIARYGGGDASIHGFRTSFKTWATDNGCDDLLSEQALAHSDRDKVRAAYQRSDMLERRRELMQAWADYILPTA